ncbi:hypothetical protein, partial [Klebsiella pneumoniae]|uniref:hypothetical protein n=1 Tax=Klebsiella pneumoniae TaxID=573 RepID=UPI003C707110
MYLNINQLLKEKNVRKNGADFISVTKLITNENMGKDNRFTPADLADIKAQPFVEDAAPLMSNQFRVKASAGTIIPFSTDLFLSWNLWMRNSSTPYRRHLHGRRDR